MTYREVMAVMAGRSRYLQFKVNSEMRAAWHQAAFERMKRMPRLETILQTNRKRVPPQTPEQQAKVAEHWLKVMQQRGLKVTYH